MAKINKTYIKNIKNIDEFQADLNGVTAYIVGGNTKGKTTLCTFLINRLMGDKPDADVLKDKLKKGEASIKMDDGAEFRYTISPNGAEKITYINSNGIEVRATREIIGKYLPNKFFDVNKFVVATPKEKIYILTKALGIDISEEQRQINDLIPVREERYRQKKAKQSLFEEFKEYLTIQTEARIEELKEKKRAIIETYQKNVNEINKLNKEIEERNKKRIEEEKEKIDKHNLKIKNIEQDIEILRNIYTSIQNLNCKDDLVSVVEVIKNKGKELKELLNSMGGYKTLNIEKIEGLEKQKEIPPMPDFSEIDKQIAEAEILAGKQNKAILYKKEYDDSIAAYDEICNEITKLENIIKEKLQSVKLPPEIKITTEGVFFKNLPVDDKHLAKSELYIVSLMLSSVNLKELRTLYFDCSPLDKNNLADVLRWAKENDLQLLIEKPDFDAGELRLEIIENL
jgi:hypothetical protein